MEYLYDPNKSFQTLKVRVFRFLGDYDPVYLHCELLACYANASSGARSLFVNLKPEFPIKFVLTASSPIQRKNADKG